MNTPLASGAAPEMDEALIRLQHVSKTYAHGERKVEVLKGVQLNIARGSFEALIGPSGSGKTTLLNLIGGLDRPSAGEVWVAGVEIGRLHEAQRSQFRARDIGFVFQTYNLLPVLSALENVELPLLLSPLARRERRERALIALRAVGLEDRHHHRPGQLSGGQQQRVAIARAIVTDPRIIVADEPTGDLDRHSADQVLDLLVRLNGELHKTIVMVTHDQAAAQRASRVRQLDKGVLV